MARCNKKNKGNKGGITESEMMITTPLDPGMMLTKKRCSHVANTVLLYAVSITPIHRGYDTHSAT